jgi:hypothetical protein
MVTNKKLHAKATEEEVTMNDDDFCAGKCLTFRKKNIMPNVKKHVAK